MSRFSKITGISEDTILYEHVVKIITIGKMIEILSSKYDLLIDFREIPTVRLSCRVLLFEESEPELCDALWEAVKFMIENLEE
jgi:hypothetical protein